MSLYVYFTEDETLVFRYLEDGIEIRGDLGWSCKLRTSELAVINNERGNRKWPGIGFTR